MPWQQRKSPNLQQTDTPGWCLRFTQSAFGGPHRYAYAWQQWTHSKQHMDALPNVCVPVYFSWTGTIDGVRQNWGDVAIYVPGKGVFGTPFSGGKGHRWDKDVQARARAIGGGAQYVGWSEDLAGQAVAQYVAPKPAPAVRPKTTPPKTITLPRANPTWRVYRVAGPYTVGHEIGKLAPAKFGGLTYAIEKQLAPSVYQIKTRDFGTVAIYGGPETGAIIK